MQIQAKTGGILYHHGGKPGSNYPDLKPGLGTRFRLPSSCLETKFCYIKVEIIRSIPKALNKLHTKLEEACWPRCLCC